MGPSCLLGLIQLQERRGQLCQDVLVLILHCLVDGLRSDQMTLAINLNINLMEMFGPAVNIRVFHHSSPKRM